MATPGVLDGVRDFARALGFIAGRPRNWPLAAVPMTIFVLLAGGATASAVMFARRILPNLLGVAADGILASIATWLVGFAALLVGVLLGLALSQPLAGPALETLCRRQEAALGVPRHHELPWGLSMRQSVGAAIVGIAVAAVLFIPLTLIGWLFPPAGFVTVPLKILVTGGLVAWDLLDIPMTLRGMPLGQRWQWMKAHAGACMGFGLAASAFLTIPILGLLVLPAGAVGASRLMFQVESNT